MSIKIVAFLQNPWFKPGTDERTIHLYRDDQRFHRRVLTMCMTGQRLKTAFGDLYDVIHWDNTNWRPANHATGREEPDHQHMIDVIKKEKPRLILCFGNQAKEAMDTCFMEFFFAYPHLTTFEPPMHCHHPNARHKTIQDLCDFAIMVRTKIHEFELLGQDPPLNLDDAMSLEGRDSGQRKKV